MKKKIQDKAFAIPNIDKYPSEQIYKILYLETAKALAKGDENFEWSESLQIFPNWLQLLPIPCPTF